MVERAGEVAEKFETKTWAAGTILRRGAAEMRASILHVLMIATLTLALSNGVVFAGPLDDALAAYKRGDYSTMLQLIQPLAAQGNASAQTALGVLYAYGTGVPKDYNKWYRLAAEHGNAQGETNLGLMYANRLGVPKDYNEAVKWYRLAAEQGNAMGASNLGWMYANGQGLPTDYVLSDMWLTVGKSNPEGIISKMTPAQIELAHKMAERCIDLNYRECGESQGGGQFSVPVVATRWADPGTLRAFVGKYTEDQVDGLKLVEVPEVRSRIQMLFGANVANLID